MAKNETRRLKPSVLQADRDSFAALKAITGYAPANSGYSIAAIATIDGEVTASQSDEVQKAAAAAGARDTATAKEWQYHNAILGAKDQLMAQFGRDSNEVQAVGLKKKSEYKPRSPSKKKTPTP
jgi:hypothetical protein